MKVRKKAAGYLLIAFGIIVLAASLFFYVKAWRIEEQLLEKIGDDPFAIVFTNKIEPEGPAGKTGELVLLNNQMAKNKNRGWWLFVGGFLVVIAGISVNFSDRKAVETLGIAPAE